MEHCCSVSRRSLYQLFAQKLYASPIPSGLSESERDIYRVMLEEQALPIEEHAFKTLEFAHKKARELGIQNNWTNAFYMYSKDMTPQLTPSHLRVFEHQGYRIRRMFFGRSLRTLLGRVLTRVGHRSVDAMLSASAQLIDRAGRGRIEHRRQILDNVGTQLHITSSSIAWCRGRSACHSS